MTDRTKNAIGFLFLLAWLIVIADTIGSYRKCEARGGTFVRDIVWYTCIQEAPRD